MWEHDGIICTGETYKSVVKLTFAKGAALEDPSGLFNSSLEGNIRRAIDFHEGDKIDEKALKALIRAAVALNMFGARCPEETKARLRKTTALPRSLAGNAERADEFAARLVVDLVSGARSHQAFRRRRPCPACPAMTRIVSVASIVSLPC